MLTKTWARKRGASRRIYRIEGHPGFYGCVARHPDKLQARLDGQLRSFERWEAVEKKVRQALGIAEEEPKS